MSWIRSLMRLSLSTLACLTASCAQMEQPAGTERVQAKHATASSELERLSVESSSVELSGILTPMGGPRSDAQFQLKKTLPEKVYLQKAKLSLVADQSSGLPQTFLQSATVQWCNPRRHWELVKSPFGQTESSETNSLFAFCQQQTSIELPPNCGLPLMSNEPLALTVQWTSRDPYTQAKGLRAKLELEFTHRPQTDLSCHCWSLVEGRSATWNVPPKGLRITSPVTPPPSGYRLRALQPILSGPAHDITVNLTPSKQVIARLDPLQVLVTNSGIGLSKNGDRSGPSRLEISAVFENPGSTPLLGWGCLMAYFERSDH